MKNSKKKSRSNAFSLITRRCRLELSPDHEDLNDAIFCGGGSANVILHFTMTNDLCVDTDIETVLSAYIKYHGKPSKAGNRYDLCLDRKILKTRRTLIKEIDVLSTAGEIIIQADLPDFFVKIPKENVRPRMRDHRKYKPSNVAVA